MSARLLLPVLFGVILVGASTAQAKDPDGAPAPGKLVVGFHCDLPTSVGAEYYGARVVRADPVLRYVVIEAPDVKKLERALERDPAVRYVHEETYYFLQMTPLESPLPGQDRARHTGPEAACDRAAGALSARAAVVNPHALCGDADPEARYPGGLRRRCLGR